jgi:hypothetical protein
MIGLFFDALLPYRSHWLIYGCKKKSAGFFDGMFFIFVSWLSREMKHDLLALMLTGVW